MADNSVPYVQAYGNITKVLDKIQTAAVPGKFTHEFLADTLGLSGGSASALIPFLKRTGFLASDGTPTDLYKRYRNTKTAGAAAAEALRVGYKPLFTINETLNKENDKDLKGVIVQCTGAQPDSSTVRATVGSFKALKAKADFSAKAAEDAEDELEDRPGDESPGDEGSGLGTLNLGYTINLHLPPTSDVAVFNAIFKSLKENLL